MTCHNWGTSLVHIKCAREKHASCLYVRIPDGYVRITISYMSYMHPTCIMYIRIQRYKGLVSSFVCNPLAQAKALPFPVQKRSSAFCMYTYIYSYVTLLLLPIVDEYLTLISSAFAPLPPEKKNNKTWVGGVLKRFSHGVDACFDRGRRIFFTQQHLSAEGTTYHTQ